MCQTILNLRACPHCGSDKYITSELEHQGNTLTLLTHHDFYEKADEEKCGILLYDFDKEKLIAFAQTDEFIKTLSNE